MGRGEGRVDEAGQRLVVMITGGDGEAGDLTVLVLLALAAAQPHLGREEIFSFRRLVQGNSG